MFSGGITATVHVECVSVLAVVNVEDASPGLGEQEFIMTHDPTRSTAQSRQGPDHGPKEAMTPRQ